jgi:DNA polymerase I-like protein with 3'-5' exonuclease and polymerase domains
MSAWGLRTDPVRVEQYATQLQEEYDDIETKLQEAELVRDNGVRDTKAAAAYVTEVCNQLGREVALTDKERVKLDKDTLEQLGDELLAHYATFSGLKKKIGTDIKLLRKGVETPIQPRFFALVSSGRTSCGDKEDVGNVQNLPRKKGVRECFVPRDGNVFAAADFDGFELRTGAQCCLNLVGHSALAEALNAGKDPHLIVAKDILAIPYEEALSRKKEPDVDDARQTGKVANFGFPGGLGFIRLVIFARKQYNVILTEDEAKELKRNWLRLYPEWEDYFSYISKLVGSPGNRIEHLFSGRFRGDMTYTEACNTFFQGLAADAAKAAGFLISKACYVDTHSPLYGCRPVNFIHDEFIVEAPEDTAAEAAEELARLMVVGASPYLPDVPPKAEALLMRRWSKSAYAMRDEAGRLVAWDES